ncbi:hypothetical protein JA1_001162 [Spathaspora sp. JA1]|nr:hypothetical protein JA1_001162 [Spathaspora sp. JA1]
MSDTHKNTNVAEILFNDIKYANESPRENEPQHDYSHVELLLQLTAHSNKYYVQFQSHAREFIDIPTSSESQIYRWTGSSIELAQSAVLDHWVSQKVKQPAGGVGESGKSGAGGGARSSMLFSWSSTDASIESRRAKLNKGPRSNSIITAPTITPIEQRKIDLLQKLNMPCKTTEFTGKLSRIVESESTRFMNARVQLIRTRNSEYMNKLISERKKKDHELHLQKLKQMEMEQAESEKSLVPPESKGGGLFGLFGFGGSSSTMGSHAASTLKLQELEQTSKDTSFSDDHRRDKEKEKQTKSNTLFERETPTPAVPEEDIFISVNDLEQALAQSTSQLKKSDDGKEEEVDEDEEFSAFTIATMPSQQSKHKFLPIGGEIKDSISKSSSISNDDNLLDL